MHIFVYAQNSQEIGRFFISAAGEAVMRPKKSANGELPFLLDTAHYRKPVLQQKPINFPLWHRFVVRFRVLWIVQWHLEACFLVPLIATTNSHKSRFSIWLHLVRIVTPFVWVGTILRLFFSLMFGAKAWNWSLYKAFRAKQELQHWKGLLLFSKHLLAANLNLPRINVRWDQKFVKVANVYVA